MLKHILALISFVVSFTDLLFFSRLYFGVCWFSQPFCPVKKHKIKYKVENTAHKKCVCVSVFAFRENSFVHIVVNISNKNGILIIQLRVCRMKATFLLQPLDARKNFLSICALTFFYGSKFVVFFYSKIQFSLFNWHDCCVTIFIESISMVFFLEFFSYKSKFDCCA